MENLFFSMIGIALGWMASQYRMVITENANIISDHIKDMEVFSKDIQEYWLNNAKNIENEISMAARVRAQHAAISVFYGEARKRMSLTRWREYQVLQLKLFSVATGDDFETSDRKSSPDNAIESYRICSEIIHLLRIARREQVSLKATLSNFRQKVSDWSRLD